MIFLIFFFIKNGSKIPSGMLLGLCVQPSSSKNSPRLKGIMHCVIFTFQYCKYVVSYVNRNVKISFSVTIRLQILVKAQSVYIV